MSVEILTPFALGPGGQIAVTTDPSVQTQQHVDSLVSTRPGERAMIPSYGVDIPAMLFGQGTAIVAQALTSDVQQAMATFEPGVNVITVSPVTDQGDLTEGIVSLQVDYTTSAPNGNSAPASTTATVLVGGTVIEGSAS
jgi:phage baseplate assembly protein W